ISDRRQTAGRSKRAPTRVSFRQLAADPQLHWIHWRPCPGPLPRPGRAGNVVASLTAHPGRGSGHGRGHGSARRNLPRLGRPAVTVLWSGGRSRPPTPRENPAAEAAAAPLDHPAPAPAPAPPPGAGRAERLTLAPA